MKRIQGKHILAVFITIVGLGMMTLAFTANLIGLDPNEQWGPHRKFLLQLGSLLLISSVIIFIFTIIDNKVIRKRLPRMGQRYSLFISKLVTALSPLLSTITESPLARNFKEKVGEPLATLASRLRGLPLLRDISWSERRKAALLSTILFSLVGLIYVWFISVGYWTKWPTTTYYYDQLASAFKTGQIHLLTEPSPKLVALSDPYEFDQRKGLAVIWDASLYNGKYYLYWGPVPALFMAVFKFIISDSIGDHILVFVFVTGTFFFSVLLIFNIWQRHFSNLPWWALIPNILVIGLANPMPWMLNNPFIYQAAIYGGQFFLIGGLYFTICAMKNSRWSTFLFVLASTFWVFAVGTRMSLIPAVVFLAATVGLRIATRSAGSITKPTKLYHLLAVYLPLILGAALLSWYNYTRFGSIFEFGLRYALTSINLLENYDKVFSLSYIPANIFNYLINPLRTLPVFPYVKPIWGTSFFAPAFFLTEQITGLLITTPFIVFALVPGFMLIHQLRRKEGGACREPGGLKDEKRSFRWLVMLLIGAVLLELVPILVIYTSTMRYLADAVTVLIVLAAIGFWQSYRYFHSKKAYLFRRFLLLAVFFALVTIVLSLLLGISGHDLRFEKLNPDLFERLTQFLTW